MTIAVLLLQVQTVLRLAGALGDQLALAFGRAHPFDHREVDGGALNRQFDDFDKSGCTPSRRCRLRAERLNSGMMAPRKSAPEGAR
ncbi:hypothetical protein WJ978_27455 [Achromobacter xylosoxidans]